MLEIGVGLAILVLLVYCLSKFIDRPPRSRSLGLDKFGPYPPREFDRPVSPPPVQVRMDPREVEGEIYLDIETLRLSNEVPGGWSSIEKFGLAVAVTWDLAGQFRVWYEPQTNDLIAELKKFERIVTYNGDRFDLKVLSGYGSTRGLPTRSFDVLVHLQHAIGYRVKLDDVAFHTLGTKKTGDGLDAVRWWREGKRDVVAEYCKNDVELLVRLVAHARQHGHISTRGRRVSVDWSPLSATLTRKAAQSGIRARAARSGA